MNILNVLDNIRYKVITKLGKMVRTYLNGMYWATSFRMHRSDLIANFHKMSKLDRFFYKRFMMDRLSRALILKDNLKNPPKPSAKRLRIEKKIAAKTAAQQIDIESEQEYLDSGTYHKSYSGGSLIHKDVKGINDGN